MQFNQNESDLEKNTITNDNFRVYKKESIHEDVFVQKLLRREKLIIIHLVKLTLMDQYH